MNLSNVPLESNASTVANNGNCDFSISLLTAFVVRPMVAAVSASSLCQVQQFGLEALQELAN